MAYKGAILEPKITLESVDGDDIIMNASPEWKQKLVDFLKYAATTDDAEVHAFVPEEALNKVCSKISRQVTHTDRLVLSKVFLLDTFGAFNALSILSRGAFYDYSWKDFDRLHDDFLAIRNMVFASKAEGPLRIKTGLSGDFDG